MPRVYRVECPTCGLGPYNCSCLHRKPFTTWMRESSFLDSYLRERPGMLTDVPTGKLDKVWDKFCGFLSENQLKSWFEGELDSLIEEKFRLAIYEVSSYITGKSGRQVFFHKQSTPKYRLLRCGIQFL